ncbi:MAG: class I SAM-dependent methyltransferase [Candidatus Eremiobacteraeota bacterium]|nr:class I SAM-dependent methyltransferase [Candidatus Eremiobacteraeota bacterium]
MLNFKHPVIELYTAYACKDNIFIPGGMMANQESSMICPQCGGKLKLEKMAYTCEGICKRKYPVTEDGLINFIPPSLPPEKNYRRKFLKELAKAERDHFWYNSRNRVILDMIHNYCKDQIKNKKHRMLDLGCGSGVVAGYLRRARINCTGGDCYREALEICKTRQKVPSYLLDARALPFSKYFDIIGTFDLLEHMEDDVEIMKQIHKGLKPGGKFIFTVPADPKLFGRYDEICLHKRRYTKKELEEKLRDAGFIPEKLSYFLFILYPFHRLINYLNKTAGDQVSDTQHLKRERAVIPVLNLLMELTVEIERHLLKIVDLPFGSAIIGVARKVS